MFDTWSDDDVLADGFSWQWQVFCEIRTGRGHEDLADAQQRMDNFLERIGQTLRSEPHLFRQLPLLTPIWRTRPMKPGSQIDSYKKVAELGPAPANKATNNRFSPAGVSMFYGADSEDTAIKETFADDSTVHGAVGKFELGRSVKILDLAELPLRPSIFNKAQSESFHTLRFLEGFAADVSRPVGSNDDDRMGYLPTQLFTERLRELNELRIDGIRYSSSRTGGPCYVLFATSADCRDSFEPDHGEMLVLDTRSVYERRT